MDNEIYYGLKKYLTGSDLFFNVADEHQEIIKKIANEFRIDHHHELYKKPTSKHQTARIVIPKCRKFQILEENHDEPLAGHFGRKNTLDRIIRKYYWPNMRRDVDDFVESCPECQKRAPRTGEAPLTPIARTPIPFFQFGIDVMGPLPNTLQDHRYIVIAVDHFTKWVEAKALSEINGQNIAAFIYKEVICRHGVPKVMTSDRGVEFNNQLIRILTETYNIKHITTTAYHPQGNGQVERMNRTIKNILSKLSKGENWDHYLDSAIFAVNTSRSESTKFTASELLYGFQLPRSRKEDDTNQISFSQDEDDLDWYVTEEIARLKKIRQDAMRFISIAQARQKARHDRENQNLPPLNIGDLVLLYRSTVEENWSGKLEPKWEGPYYIQDIKKGSSTTYSLRKTNGTILSDTFHRNKLKKFHGRRY
jgi:transposase InsO family protein